jgi:hypothetical protein
MRRLLKKQGAHFGTVTVQGTRYGHGFDTVEAEILLGSGNKIGKYFRINSAHNAGG